MPLKILMTGGIGSGKSSVSKYFTDLGVPIIDADDIVHDLYVPNTITYKKIVHYFGKNILTKTQEIDRNKLHNIIFSRTNHRIWLETLIHPKVKLIMENQLKTIFYPYCILIVPLFFETKYRIDIDRILVIHCQEYIRIKRIQKRNHYPINDIRSIIDVQVNDNYRLKFADDIIYNNSTMHNIEIAVKFLHNYYLSLT